MLDICKKTGTAIYIAVAFGGAVLSAGSEITINPQQQQSFTGRDDLAQLKHLALAVGWEFVQTSDTVAQLKNLGIRKIRCINVEGLSGDFDKDGNYIIDTSKPSRLDAHLKTCAELGAVPHIIIGQNMPKTLQIKAEIQDDGVSLMGGGKKSLVCGPSDYRLYRNYWAAYFEYVMVTKGFKNAVFEVFNEPDISAVTCPAPPTPERGSAALYEITFNLYTHVVAAAEQFEQKHPGAKVTIGGPALAWAYTFRFGSFNWCERFVRDCAEKKIRLNFIGVHAYGNISSINGEYKSTYPSFVEMLNSLKKVRDQYLPGTPIQINEWGPSYHTSNTDKALVNADNIGAAWSIEFLKTMLENGIDDAIFLVTDDLTGVENGKKVNIWGWPSLMVNPQIFGYPYPKAICNLFEMIAAMNGKRIESTRNGNINSFATADPKKKKIQVIVWNFAARLPESNVPVDFSIREHVPIKIRNADVFFGSNKIKVSRKLISETNSNALYWFKKGEKLTPDNTGLKTVDQGEYQIINGEVSAGCDMPPSSVAMIEIEGI